MMTAVSTSLLCLLLALATTAAAAAAAAAKTPIKHVVVLMLENHSYDNFFGMSPKIITAHTH
jgi:phospholipase C